MSFKWEEGQDIFEELDGDPVTEQDTPENVLDDIDGDEEKVEVVPEVVTLEDLDEEVDEKVVAQEEAADVLKATAEYKANKYGIDISEVEKWDEETYAAFEDKLDDIRLEQKYNEAKSSNPLVEALLTITESGGEINDVLSLFEQQKEFSEIDTTTVEGKLEKIKKFYKDVDGKTPEWINRYVKKLQVSEDQSDVEEEFNSINQQYEDYVREEKENLVQQQIVAKQQKEVRAKKQLSDFSQALESKKFSKAQSKDLLEFAFTEKYKVRGTNQILSGLDVEIAKAKATPEKLINVALLLKDEEEFKKRIITEYTNQKNETKFRTIVNKQTVNNNSEPINKQTQVKFKVL